MVNHLLSILFHQLHLVFNAVMTIAFYEIIKQHLAKRQAEKERK